MSENKVLRLTDAMKYPNAKVQEYERKMPFKKSSDYQNIKDFIEFKVINFGCLGESMITHCKLILRPLSSLTEKEKEKLNDLDTQIKVIHTYDVLYKLNRISVSENSIDLIDYLRSINIDIDGLEKRGIAVYE